MITREYYIQKAKGLVLQILSNLYTFQQLTIIFFFIFLAVFKTLFLNYLLTNK